MKKILVLGEKGMLGHLVYDYLRNKGKYKISGLGKDTLDATKNKDEIEKILSKFSLDYVINCMGLINKYADTNPEITKKINTEFPHILSNLAIKYGWKLIHISSDCYLDQDIYGRSKKLGEIDDSHNLTIRTSIIGPEIKEGAGLFHWFMSQKESVNGFRGALWDGVTTFQLAKFIEEEIDSEENKGILDYRTKESTNKYALLKLVSKIFNKNIEIHLDDRKMKDKRNLNADKWCLNNYESQIIDLKNYMQENEEKYQRYFQVS